MTYMIFYNRRDPLFKMMPDDARSLTFPLSFSTTPQGISVERVLIHSFRGDFNGDGRCDLLIRGKGDSILVYFGLENGTFSEDPDLTIAVQILDSSFSVTTRTEDVTGDGRADLFLHQKSEEKEHWDLYLSE
jgi:hypothetical protein